MTPHCQFQPLSFSWVALHPHPRGVIQFMGGAFFGSLPTVFYRYLLTQLFDQGYTIVALPFRFSFRHWAIAASLFQEQSQLRSLLAQEAQHRGYASEVYQDVKTYVWLGHSVGCKYIALLEFLSDPERQAILKNVLGQTEAARINRVVDERADGQCVSIKGQPSLILAPDISDTESAIPLQGLAQWLDQLKLGVLPTRQQTQTLIERSRLFNLTGLISFAGDRIAGSQAHPEAGRHPDTANDVVWFLSQLRQKAFPLLTQELPGQHLEPLGLEWRGGTWNPFGALKSPLRLRFLEPAVSDCLKELNQRNQA